MSPEIRTQEKRTKKRDQREETGGEKEAKGQK